MTNLVFEKDFPRHPLHYFTLLCMELIGLWGLLWFGSSRPWQMSILISMAAAYVIWGLLHHREHHDLHPKIIWEYLLWAIFGVLIVGSLILRS